jgi:hypothetical protein
MTDPDGGAEAPQREYKSSNIKSSNVWNPALCAELKRLWEEENWTGGQIAKELGFTRCAIMGKVRRLGLARRNDTSPVPRVKQARRPKTIRRAPFAASTPKEAVVPQPVPAPPPLVEGGIHLFDLESHHCRAVIGTGPDHIARFCGQPVHSRYISSANRIITVPYCGPHGDIYYNASRSSGT